MNKKQLLLATLLCSTILSAEITNEELLKRVELLETQNAIMQKLTVGGDYRFSIDNLKYEMANGSTVRNSALYTNRLWLDVNYKENEHLNFHAKLAFNKVFGETNITPSPIFDQFDWFGSTTNTDNQLRVKEAYIDYKSGEQYIPWDFGVGRRPTSYTKLLSLRDDQAPNSPLGHIVSAEFDGGHLGFKLENLIGLKGASIKLAAGRGMSNITPSMYPTPNSDNGDNIDMYAVNVVFYDSKNFHTELQVLQATNLVDITNAGYDQFGSFNPANYDPTLQTVGDINLASFMAIYQIEMLNDTKVFASFARSETLPDSNQAMLGSSESEVGTSYWIGTQVKSLITEHGHWGAEFNHGSKYFRPFTYAEDTVVGSKMATRGNAYEVYFTEELMKGLTCQLRYTYLDYEYTGSNGFFGSQTGTPMKIDDIPSSIDLANSIVSTAQDFRVYLRYHF